MESFGFFYFLILVDFSSSLDRSLITVFSFPPVSGVVLLTGPWGKYQFDFSEAKEACLFKNVSMATIPQLQRALDHGLETCKFGWVSEQIVAVPRLSSVSTCGGGKTGVVTWTTPEKLKFGVWCFNASDFKEASKITPTISTTYVKTTPPPTFTTTTILTTVTTSTTTSTSTAISTTSITTSTSTAISTTSTLPKTSKATNPTTKPLTTRRTILHVSSTLAPWIHSTVKPKTTTKTVSTTKSSVGLIHSSSTFGSTSTSSFYGEAISSASVNLPKQRVLSRVLIIFCVIVLILIIGGALFYYKFSERCGWSPTSQKDDTEAEMWKIQEEEDERREREEEEGEEREEKRFTICSETMLYANHETRMN
ncbi:hypothetical protein NL108_014669 [Boleophthalmus pectinirostris]|uniref:lymphatic vessel endothelial hyaluronic receptor 1b n=1 Tax=Boleophthalmus pectinirostris TaxID=150288 RepID=UPI00242FF631|nr:lymphatic vessel endothelial hyaluronic receptor 1b [Boleophthalmus pectinirostris]KAJ0069797.1 hypothetical protein NL108_014669 [Boleophthalmus pectinirostris]